jgi:hypothetical protein
MFRLRPESDIPTQSAVPSPHVVSDVGSWSAPAVLAALASIVHDRQRAAGHGHDRSRGEDNQQGRLHFDLATAGPPKPTSRRVIPV